MHKVQRSSTHSRTHDMVIRETSLLKKYQTAIGVEIILCDVKFDMASKASNCRETVIK